jgi:hypothetical protein
VQVTEARGVKIYNVSSGKTLPEWLSDKVIFRFFCATARESDFLGFPKLTKRLHSRAEEEIVTQG